MRKAVATSLILVIAVGLVLSVVGSVVAQWLLTHVLKVSEDILADATAYFAIYCFGLVFQFAYNIVSFILRSLGDSAAHALFPAGVIGDQHRAGPGVRHLPAPGTCPAWRLPR